MSLIVCLPNVGLTEGECHAREPSSLFLAGDSGVPDDYENYLPPILDRGIFSDLLPKRFNWAEKKKVSSPKNQGPCYCCWAFAAVGVLESKIAIQYNITYDLSEQQQISCNKKMYKCSGGNAHALALWQDQGPLEEHCAKYGYERAVAEAIKCKDLQEKCMELPYRVSSYTIDTPDTAIMQDLLYHYGPAYFRFDLYNAFEDFMKNAQPGDVYKEIDGKRMGRYGHAVLLIGWDDTKEAWLCQDSCYNPNCGMNCPNEDGTFWIAYEHEHKVNLNFTIANIRELIEIDDEYDTDEEL